MSTERKDAPKVALETYDSIKCSRLIRGIMAHAHQAHG
jgi:hypothetical protein